MSFLGDEINKLKRKAPADGGRYIKRADVETERREQYLKDQELLRSKRLERESQKVEQLRQIEIVRQAKLEKEKRARASNAAVEETVDIEATKAKLRDLKEPVKLFGERELDIAKRLKRIQNELSREDSPLLANRVYQSPPDAELPDADTLVIDPKMSKSDTSTLNQTLYTYYRIQIRHWGHTLSKRHRDVAASNEGQLVAKHYEEARDHLARLLSRLKAENLPNDILKNLGIIGSGLQEGRFNQANDAYLRMSIGNSKWPVGVTMVGIHERAIRDKIQAESSEAHILNDESTRKWLQSLKRLITFMEAAAT